MQRVRWNNIKGTEGKESPGNNGLRQGKNSWQMNAMKAFQLWADNLTKIRQNNQRK